MAAKFDVEQVKKHLFWILLGVAALIEIVAIALLMVSDPAAEKRKEYVDRQKEMKSISDFKNSKFLPPWEERKNEFTGEKMSFGKRRGSHKSRSTTSPWVSKNLNTRMRNPAAPS